VSVGDPSRSEEVVGWEGRSLGSLDKSAKINYYSSCCQEVCGTSLERQGAGEAIQRRSRSPVPEGELLEACEKINPKERW